MCQGSGGKDIFKYRRIHQQRSNRLKVINITFIPLLGILETNSFHKDSDSEPIHCWKSAYTQVYKAYGRLRSSEASARSPASLYFVFAVVLSLSVCPPLSRCLCTSCWLLLPFLAASVFLSLPLSGLDCAVRAVIVCLCVISCLNEGQVNEINFSCPYMGIALTDSRIVRLCLSVCVCHVAPRLPARLCTRRLALHVKLLHHLYPA